MQNREKILAGPRIDSFPAYLSRLSFLGWLRGANQGVAVRNVLERVSSGEGEFRCVFSMWCLQGMCRALSCAERKGLNP